MISGTTGVLPLAADFSAASITATTLRECTGSTCIDDPAAK
jgi:hypothetical protein